MGGLLYSRFRTQNTCRRDRHLGLRDDFLDGPQRQTRNLQVCRGIERNATVTITGYDITTNDIDIIANCGSFDIDLHFESNGTYVQSFWLQEYNPVTGTWGHPLTGVSYPEGTLPGNSNSVFLNNNQLNLNLAYTGQFRIIRAWHIYSNGNSLNHRCLEVIGEFEFDGAPSIVAAYSFPCNDNTSEVIIDALGIPPLTYEITTMDGDPFVVDNGESNLFSGLEPGTYNFRVTDVCGSFVNIQIDISVLEPIEITAIGFCDGQDSTLSVQNFTFLDYEWYEQGSPGTILSTSNILSFPSFNPATDTGTYVVSISSSNAGSCINQEIEYVVVPTDSPEAGEDNEIGLCNEGTPLNLADYLSDGHDEGGTWEDVNTTGALTGSTLATAGLPGGIYEFIYSVSSDCGVTDSATITVELTQIPGLPVVEDVAPLCAGEDIELSVEAIPGAVYEWNGPGGFTSDEQNPVIENASTSNSGTYTLVITVNECASPMASVEVQVQSATAQAGGDVTAIICNDGSTVSLEDYLNDPHDAGGIWEDLDGTGAITGGTLDMDGVMAGTYEFRYTVTNACNATDEAILAITLNDIPAAPVVSASGPVCEGGDVQLSATAVPGAIYAWTGPDNFTSDEQNPLIEGATVAADGMYTLIVTVNDCASPAATVNAIVNAAPQFTFEGNETLCQGQTGSITIVPANFDSASADYEWRLNGQPLADSAGTIDITESGTYEVIVEANGCASSQEFVVSANSNAFEVVLEIGCVNYDYMIQVVNIDEIPGATVSWTGPEGYASSEPDNIITGFASGDYVATVTNAEGCSVTATVVADNTACFIPRGISPNNDGDNDSFDISNLEARNIKIFNRYGMMVYEKENYRDEWHGQSEQGTLPTGTYFYMITLSAGEQITGWVYLQREL